MRGWLFNDNELGLLVIKFVSRKAHETGHTFTEQAIIILREKNFPAIVRRELIRAQE